MIVILYFQSIKYNKLYFTESGNTNSHINIKNDGAAIIEIGEYCTNVYEQAR